MKSLERHLYPKLRLVFLSQEPPAYTWDRFGSRTSQPVDYVDFFNWTMTFRNDSDISFNYGSIKHKSTTIFRNQIHFNFNSKNESSAVVAWMVSHCSTHGRREDYVKELKRHIKVDVYGSCGHLKCYRNPAVGDSPPECYSQLEQRYKFYLAFENSICTDYVTEKFFEILKRRIIPVVYGGADYSRIAPPYSYIDARQFEPKELADYLIQLDANETLYNEYFLWKDYYQVEAGQELMVRRGFCHLCQKLHQDDEDKVYHNLLSDWVTEKQCVRVPRNRYNKTVE